MQVASIDGTTFTSDDLVSWLKLSGRFSTIVEEMITEKLTATAAKRQGMEVSTPELQRAADNHRRAHGLQRVDAANDFLDAANVTLELYEAFIEDGVLAEKLQETLVDDAKVNEYFALHKPDFEAIDIGHIVVSRESTAQEIFATLEEDHDEDEDTFAELAAEASIAQTADHGGRVGKLFRNSLPEVLEAKLFTGTDGEVFGPWPTDDDCYEIFKVYKRYEAKLDNLTTDIIKRRLYDRWLNSAAVEFNVEA